MNQTEKFKSILDELIKLGENSQELNFWLALFPHLSESEQQEILSAFTKEFERLSHF